MGVKKALKPLEVHGAFRAVSHLLTEEELRVNEAVSLPRPSLISDYTVPYLEGQLKVCIEKFTLGLINDANVRRCTFPIAAFV